ncbi:MAG: hypothetical protein MJ158_03960, partial [Alphaproteobacteria bacterium]|nr:hypothetical protein [Alphaproteobacteria bacterium]
RIDGVHPALIALGTNEQLFIATNDIPVDVLEKTIKHIELCFADTLEGIAIKIQVFNISNQHYNDGNIKTFRTTSALRTYLEEHKNKKPSSKSDLDAFEAYSDYITNVLEYLFKQQ